MAFGARELPDDLATEVLRRLPPRSMSVSRCVCRGWRDLVDAGRLLRVDLLPRSVGGIFMHYMELNSPEFLARPTTGRRSYISGDLDSFIPGFQCSKVLDHCNGLLLCTGTSRLHDCITNPATRRWPRDYVANPATRRWARLPQRPRPSLLGTCKRKRKRKEEAFLRQIQIKWLVYDPTISPHYEVFLIHSPRDQRRQRFGLGLPSCLLQVQVYSSVTGRWEERLFLPEQRVVPTIALSDRASKVYWRGALYLLCENDGVVVLPQKINDGFVLRVSISDAKYRLIPVPADVGFSRSYGSLSLGTSDKGVYCAFLYNEQRLRIFLLNNNETSSCGQTIWKWELKHSVDFTAFSRKLYALKGHSDDHQQNGPWMLQDTNYYKYHHGNDKHREIVEDRFEWNSDDDNVLSIEDTVEGDYPGYMSVLGFHPYKEIVFLNANLSRAVAYCWNTSKFQDLGNICPQEYHVISGASEIKTSFIYTPCWIDGGFTEEEKSVSAN